MSDDLPRQECCREWLADTYNKCGKLAVAILWGKLFPDDALGPRCEEHTSLHCGGRGLSEIFYPGRAWAVYDLRPVNKLHGG